MGRIEKDGGALRVRVGGDCFVRALPSAAGMILGVAKRGEALPYGGVSAENGWLSARCAGGLGWVSGRYGRLVV